MWTNLLCCRLESRPNPSIVRPLWVLTAMKTASRSPKTHWALGKNYSKEWWSGSSRGELRGAILRPSRSSTSPSEGKTLLRPFDFRVPRRRGTPKKSLTSNWGGHLLSGWASLTTDVNILPIFFIHFSQLLFIIHPFRESSRQSLNFEICGANLMIA